MDAEAKEYVAYYRVSTKMQGISGLGLEAQQADCHRYVERAGGALVAQYNEIESGGNNKRPVLAHAIAEAKGRGAILLIARLDRLTRDVGFLSALQKDSVRFVCVDMPEANELTITIMAAFAQAERKSVSSRTKKGLEAKKARGEVIRREVSALSCPSVIQKCISTRMENLNGDERRVDLLFEIFMMRFHRVEYQRIAEILNGEGKRHPKSGKEFTAMSVLFLTRTKSANIKLAEWQQLGKIPTSGGETAEERKQRVWQLKQEIGAV